MSGQQNGNVMETTMETPEMTASSKPGETMRTHRVGTITCGLVLVLYGILFLLRWALPFLNYGIIFELWPVVLIMLGLEILIGCTGRRSQKRNFKYDFGSVLIILVMMGFSMIMAAVDYGMYYGGWYYGVW